MYILQITKIRIGPVLAFNVQRSGRMFGRVCMLKAQGLGTKEEEEEEVSLRIEKVIKKSPYQS